MAAGSCWDVPTLQDPLDTVGAGDDAPAGVELDVGRRLILSAFRLMRWVDRRGGELINPCGSVCIIAARVAAVSGPQLLCRFRSRRLFGVVAVGLELGRRQAGDIPLQ